MATILRALSNGLYQVPFGVAIFYPLIDDDVPGVYAPGHRLADCDTLSISMAKTETERKSKEHNVLTTVMKAVTELSVTVSMTVMQISPIVRAASLMSKAGKHSQAAATGLTYTIGAAVPGVYKLPDFGVENIVVTSDDDTLALGTDYLTDPASGQIEMLLPHPDVEVTYDRVAIADAFIAGIGSSTSLRGMLVIRGTNDQGPKSLIVLRDFQMSPAGARNLVASGTDPEGIQLEGIAAPVSGVAGIQPGTEIGFETDVPEAA